MKEHSSRRTVKRLYNDHLQCKVPRITNCRIFAQPSAAHGAAIALATSVTSESFSSSPFICSASARDTFHGRGRFHVPVATVAKSASALTSSSACDDAHLPRTETRGSTADPDDQPRRARSRRTAPQRRLGLPQPGVDRSSCANQRTNRAREGNAAPDRRSSTANHRFLSLLPTPGRDRKIRKERVRPRYSPAAGFLIGRGFRGRTPPRRPLPQPGHIQALLSPPQNASARPRTRTRRNAESKRRKEALVTLSYSARHDAVR